MEMHDGHHEDEFAGFEDVVALIESAATEPEPIVQASQIRAAAAASLSGVRMLQPKRRGAPRTLSGVLGRVAAAVVATVFGVSGLAAAGVLPDGAQDAVAGVAELVGIRLSIAPSPADPLRVQDSSVKDGSVANEMDPSTTSGDDSGVNLPPESGVSADDCDDTDLGEQEELIPSGDLGDDDEGDDDSDDEAACPDDEADENSDGHSDDGENDDGENDDGEDDDGEDDDGEDDD